MKNCRFLASLFGLVLFAGTALAGNGAPSGSHYNLNIIGVPKDKTAAMTSSNMHVIFVPLWGNAKINLCDSDACADGGFQVLDGNGTDGNGALFALPSPDPDGNGTTDYSVFARALGQPNNSADMTTCATGAGDDGVFGTADDELVCSEITLTLDSTTRPSKFQNVSKYLLYVYADVDGDGILDRVPLFGDSLQDFYWNYDNNGLKLAQLRFYPCSSTIPSATDPTGVTTDNCGRTGN
ncbi:MAG: hypothetical protein HYX72_02825 [Acidobacteria bacterium]|nr:hypothetical protein [Acidobacteriota bacterium]